MDGRPAGCQRGGGHGGPAGGGPGHDRSAGADGDLRRAVPPGKSCGATARTSPTRNTWPCGCWWRQTAAPRSWAPRWRPGIRKSWWTSTRIPTRCKTPSSGRCPGTGRTSSPWATSSRASTASAWRTLPFSWRSTTASAPMRRPPTARSGRSCSPRTSAPGGRSWTRQTSSFPTSSPRRWERWTTARMRRSTSARSTTRSATTATRSSTLICARQRSARSDRPVKKLTAEARFVAGRIRTLLDEGILSPGRTGRCAPAGRRTL